MNIHKILSALIVVLIRLLLVAGLVFVGMMLSAIVSKSTYLHADQAIAIYSFTITCLFVALTIWE